MPFPVTSRSYLLLVCGLVAAAVPLVGKQLALSKELWRKALVVRLLTSVTIRFRYRS